MSTIIMSILYFISVQGLDLDVWHFRILF